MISCSHWGLFPAPRTILVVPKYSEADERELREIWKSGGYIAYADKAPEFVIVNSHDFC